MELIDLLRRTVEAGGSDLFLIPGSPVKAKIHGRLVALTGDRLLPADTEELVGACFALANRPRRIMDEEGDDDFSFSVKDLSRFRINAYRQRGSLAATCRVVTFGLPDPEKRHIVPQVMSLAELRSGMVLVTGTAGSGKSTTLACIVDRINSTRDGHIITVEDPIEFLHSHKCSLVSQREVPGDAPTFARALRSALRQAPDVIMLGEMRDTETIATAITAAETGHLVLSSLHTVGAAKTMDRIVDSFPAEQQQQIRVQLSMVLQAVVSQRLVPTLDGHQIPVFEVMRVTPAIRNLIRENKAHQIDNAIYSAGGQEMLSMDSELIRLVREGVIARETALSYSINAEMTAKRL